MRLLIAYCSTSDELANQAIKNGIRCPYIGNTVTFLDNHDEPTFVNTAYSTKRKWVKQDLGAVRVTNIKAWCGDYDRSKQLYDSTFGEGNWKVIWSNESVVTRKLFDNLKQKHI